eukprot:evm.model.NODE_42474_length_25988_cov_58.047985.4
MVAQIGQDMMNVHGGVNAPTFTGTLPTAAQPNITSVGQLSSLAVGAAQRARWSHLDR